MITVAVHKDLLNYEPKVLLILTRRTLVFTFVAVATGIAVTLALHLGLGVSVDDAMLAVIVVALPIWFVGYARPCHMTPERLAPFWLRHHFLKQQLVHVSTPHLEGSAPLAAASSKKIEERHLDHVRTIQKHYRKVRGKRGIEGIDFREPYERP